ncbi:hypothetical protein PUV54_05100 [Hyphococcus flavus]|uniref:Uncharacterized protein n=1 Tax=Hyphococcus flavus TaxID=1866326 RepID=A0AAE9ZK16_9PROT|nr:hypothetical protein [Hyphococcus flavus]WDI32571.1 hypothetical protein PUV54_05100 [Hyphococcus flavus]
MGMYQMFPLLAISLIVYAVLTLTGAVGSADVPWYDVIFIELPMVSGDTWEVTWGDVFLVASIGLLFVELLRSTKTGSESIMNHALSVVVFVIALLLFIIVQGFGNSVFFLFMSMTFLDFMAGFIVTTVTARRDLAVGGVAGG